MENSAEIDVVQLIAGGMLLAFILASAIIVFVLIYQKRIARQELKLQKMKIEHQDKLIQSAIQVTEEERKVFASNLHDEIGAQLAIAKITLSSIPDQTEDSAKIVSETLSTMDTISSSIRSISYNLRPPVLVKLGLERAIEDYVGKIPTSKINIEFSSSIGQHRFHSNEEIQAYRIMQEAISNAIKHARCTRIRVNLQLKDSAFLLSIQDNGKGFENRKTPGMGLLNMQSRAKLIDFDFELSSSENGTFITIQPSLNE